MKYYRCNESHAVKMMRLIKVTALLLFILIFSGVVFLVLTTHGRYGYFLWPLILIVLAIVIFHKDFKWLYRLYYDFLKGERGETFIASLLRESLDDDWTYIATYKIPGISIGDIDGILIGSKGAVIIEVKSWSGDLHIYCQNVFRRIGFNVFLKYNDPFEQADKERVGLKALFYEKSIHAPVSVVIALVGGKLRNIKGPTGIYITESDKLVSMIQKNYSDYPSYRNERSAILKALKVPLSAV